jgi:predicted O-methyltransferase YrrM
MKNFEDLVWLFNCDINNRGIIRQNFDEAALLWKAVKMSKGNILEIGRYEGGSTVLISTAAKEFLNRTVYSIDNAIYSFSDRLELDNVVLINADSTKYNFTIPFGFIFIDGDHSYEGVKADTQKHWNNLERDGLILYHNAVPDNKGYCAKGVSKFTHELVDNGYASFVQSAGSSLLVRKVSKDLPQ